MKGTKLIFVIPIIISNSVFSDFNITDSMYIPGDIIIGGLFSVHSAGSDTICGPVSPIFGIQEIGSVIHSLEEVNRILQNTSGFQLGMFAMDTCFNTERALEESLVLAENRYMDTGSINGTSHQNQDSILSIIKDRIIAVIGPTASASSISVATLLKLFHIPQVDIYSIIPWMF